MTSSLDRLQDDETTTRAQQQSPMLQVPKSRGNVAFMQSRDSSLALDAATTGLTEDAGAADGASYDTMSRSPVLLPSNFESGLRRIRQLPPPSLRQSSSPLLRPTDASLPPISPLTSRRSSMNHHSAGPASPALPISEDLSRFPTESLHSFSFAHQGSDDLRSRQNVLKRSIDFMREKLSWASSTPRIASAQARLAGDEELMDLMELLQKAGMQGPEKSAGYGFDGPALGPLTGPAHLANENVFERSFENKSGSSVGSLGRSGSVVEEAAEADDASTPIERVQSPIEIQTPMLAKVNSGPDSMNLYRTTTTESNSQDTLAPPPARRGTLKRTYTDVAGYSLQQRLTEAMAQPYHTNQSASSISTTNAPSFRPAPPARSGTTITERAPHGHRKNQAQAIFTTEAQAPWTITTANDLACLVFGVTRAEVRKLGIMEVIEESRRKWLEGRLKQDEVTPPSRQTEAATGIQRTTSPNSLAGAMGNGITAKLLSKPPSRQTNSSRRSKTEGGAPPSRSTPVNPHHANNKNRSVLLCGDVVPILKMNGSTGSASLWVKQKGDGLIWVLEEIAEDVAYLTIDEIGSVIRGKGDVHAIWGLERVRNGMDVQRLIPAFPKVEGTNTGAIDYDAVARLRGFTARTSNSISIPITVQQLSGESSFRVSAYPHIAGIITLSPTTMRISGSNSVFSSALFGYDKPDGLPINELIPNFDEVLRTMKEEDDLLLEDGIVIPEHSFRRARALVAMRDSSEDAAQVFLRPSGLPAKHRDGQDIMVDVQMRVVMSERGGAFNDTIISEEDEMAESTTPRGLPATELVYALWITYSRQLHAVSHGVGLLTPVMSRPGTPPQQPAPGTKGRVRGDSELPSPAKVDGRQDHVDSLPDALTTHVEEEDEDQTESAPPDAEPYEHPSPDMIAAGVKPVKKKRIDDFAILEEMGQGAYGQVKLARYKRPLAKKMVVKYVTKRRILVDTWYRDRKLGTVPLEIHVLDYLRRDGFRHPNIVEMADFFEDDVNYYIEMLPHGLPGMDLFDYIELRVTMEEVECRRIFCQVAAALAHLHGMAKVVHRDIKDENVVLDGEGRVKLVDFGSAAYIKSGPFDVFVGTIDYAAPEVLRGLPYNGKEQDVWALGILLYTIVYKENPFYSIDEIMDHDLRVPYVMSEDCIDLIRRMLDRDVERRIEIKEVLDHPWCLAVDDEEGAVS